MNMLSVSLDERFCVASRQMKLDARVGAHPSDFYSGKSHQNHSLRDASLRVPCVPRQSRRKKNSGSSIPQTPFCFLRLFLRYSVASSRSWPHFQSFRRSPPLWANDRQEGSAPADEVQQSGGWSPSNATSIAVRFRRVCTGGGVNLTPTPEIAAKNRPQGWAPAARCGQEGNCDYVSLSIGACRSGFSPT